MVGATCGAGGVASWAGAWMVLAGWESAFCWAASNWAVRADWLRAVMRPVPHSR